MYIKKMVVIMCVFFMFVATGAFAFEQERQKISNLIAEGDLESANKIFNDVTGSAGLKTIGQLTSYEELTACGFYPQETRLECIMDIKRRSGYGGPVGFTGTIEHVLFCVDWNNSGSYSQNEVVGMGTVQMHDELNNSPPWQYAVYRDFDPLGGLRTINTPVNSADTNTTAPSRKARAILSWNVAPQTCNDIPFWGNIVDFRIRFSPIR